MLLGMCGASGYLPSGSNQVTQSGQVEFTPDHGIRNIRAEIKRFHTRVIQMRVRLFPGLLRRNNPPETRFYNRLRLGASQRVLCF